jgi:lysophospholipase L1-like esterase
MNRIKAWIINFSIMFFSILLLLVILEGFSKVYIEHLADESSFKKYASVEQLKQRENLFISSMHRYIGYIPTPNFRKGKNRHNSLGLRGEEVVLPKPEGEFRIICVGGSTTYTSKVEDYKLSYPDLLQENLLDAGYNHVNVINAGMLSYTTYETLINLQLRLLDLKPDLLIIYHAVNDVHARLIWPPDAYKADNSGYRQSIYEQNLNHGSSIWTYFNLGRIVKANWMNYNTQQAKKRREGLAPSSKFYELRYQRILRTYPDGVFKEASVSQMFKVNKPIHFERNINYMISLAQAEEVKVMLSTFAFCPDTIKQSTYAFPALKEAIHEHNTVLKEIAAERNVPLFDFEKIFPQNKEYYNDDMHVNEKGSRLKSKLFSEFIISNNQITNKIDSLH